MQKRKDSCTFKREKLSTLEIQERIYQLAILTQHDSGPRSMAAGLHWITS